MSDGCRLDKSCFTCHLPDCMLPTKECKTGKEKRSPEYWREYQKKYRLAHKKVKLTDDKEQSKPGLAVLHSPLPQSAEAECGRVSWAGDEPESYYYGCRELLELRSIKEFGLG